MMHVGIEKGETTGRESSHLAFVEVVPHSNLEGPGDDSDVFPLGMPMRCDAVSIGHLQAHRVITTGSGGVALENRELRARSHERRCRTVWNCIRRESMSFRGSGLCATHRE